VRLDYHADNSWPVIGMGVVDPASVVDPEAVQMAKNADAALVFVGFNYETESEGEDRTFRLPPGQDELVNAIAAANKSTIVVLTSGGGVDMTQWIDRVPALLQAWYAGQEGGTALAQLLFGDYSPSGKLAATFERRWEDNPVHDSYYPNDGTNKVKYTEGVFVGYRGYEKNNVKPLFPFGFGLSYTTFGYSNVRVTPASGNAPATVSFDVRNIGRREGAEIAEVYVAEPQAKVPRPLKELKGFAKVNLRPGETRHVSVTLDQRAFQYYDVGRKQWVADAGEYDILVGPSSVETPLKAVFRHQ
jgi:beta-glucosidase